MKVKRDARERHNANLREKAIANLGTAPAAGIKTRTPEEILHELQVHQIELELQNEELLLSNAALEASRNLYHDLYEFAPVGYVTLTQDGRISEVSLNGAAILGDEREHLLNSRFASFVTPKDSESWHMHFLHVIQSGGKHGIELTLQRHDGSQFQARLSSLCLESEQQTTGIRIAISDITDITELKQEVAEAKIAATIFESQQGMVVTDANHVILKVNKAFSDIFGYSEQDAVGKPLHLLRSNYHDAAFHDAMWEHVRRHGFWQGEIWNQRKNGEVLPAFMTITAVNANDESVTHYVGTMIDITQRKNAEKEIRNLAFYDHLTGLPNRRLLQDRLQMALAASDRNQHEGALLLIDLDNFKILNDTLGHDIGDQLLVKVAESLHACVREGDTVARLGGDEFVVVLEDLIGNSEECATQVTHIGEKIIRSLNNIHLTDEYEFHTAASIGIALFSGHEKSAEELMKRADLAMYQAKAAGRNTLRFFDPDMQTVVTTRANMESDLRAAMSKKEYLLYFQPQVNESARLIGFEALVRWQSPTRGIVLPEEFIPAIEQTGLIIQLGLWVLEHACDQLATFGSNPNTELLTVAVNVSARQFRQLHFVDQVIGVLDSTGANPSRLKLELTESLLLDDIEDAIIKMNALKNRGVRFVLDDFGIGYASLSYLKRLPFDQLKIDQSFIHNLLFDCTDAAITKMIIGLAQNMNIEIIAEGVETKVQHDFLIRNGCRIYQGYLFSAPLPKKALEELLNQSNSTANNVSLERRWRTDPINVDRRRSGIENSVSN
ncbi:MAG TPA: EAL domain-containing protein [Burkholderiaceae bacterium]|jgi:diguanylate cyclase (GGDEF)-like protein/PAS domain S-box-containing protein